MGLFSWIYKPHRIEPIGDDSAALNLWSYVWRMTGWHQVAACVMAVVVSLLNLAPIELQRRIVNEVVESQDTALLINFGLAYLGIIVLFQLSKFLMRLYQEWLNESTNINTRQHLLKLQANEVSPDADKAGRAVSVIGTEVEKLGGFVGEALSDACANVAMLLGVVVYMFYVQPAIALFALAFMVPQVVLTPFMQRHLNRLVEERVGYLRDLGDKVSQNDHGGDTDGSPLLHEILVNRMTFNLLKFTLKAVLNLMSALGPVTVLLYGGYLVMQGETQVGVIVAFISGFERISGPVRELVGFYRVAEQARVQHEMIAKWIDRVTV